MVCVDAFHEVSHVGPLRQAQSHSFLRRLDFLLTVWDVELAKVDASDARRHRHVVTAADMMSIADYVVVAHRLDVGVYLFSTHAHSYDGWLSRKYSTCNTLSLSQISHSETIWQLD